MQGNDSNAKVTGNVLEQYVHYCIGDLLALPFELGTYAKLADS